MITLNLPKGKEFDIQKELSSARNIKDKTTRKNTITGLNKISQYL